MTTVALGLLAALALSGIAAASASAEAPEYGRCIKKATAGGAGFSSSGCTLAVGSGATYEWLSGPGAKPGFTLTSKEATVVVLETTAGVKLTCKSAVAFVRVGRGRAMTASHRSRRRAHAAAQTTYSSAKSNTAGIAFSGCESSGTSLHTEGAKEGEILTQVLECELGLVKLGTKGAVTNQIGSRCTAKAGDPKPGVFLEAEGAGLKVVVTGSVIVPVKTNKMLSTETLKWAATKGEQKPERFFEGAKETLSTSVNGGPLQQTGLTATLIQVNEGQIEVNSVV